jgi:hypothetical protein
MKARFFIVTPWADPGLPSGGPTKAYIYEQKLAIYKT